MIRTQASQRLATRTMSAATRTVLCVDPRMDPIWRSTLVEAGCTIVEVPPYADVATICAASGPHIDGMICRMPGPEGITAAVMDASPNLRVIARHGTGVDSVDLVAARERGVIVTHTGAANANAVSEFTFAAILVSFDHIFKILYD